MLLCSQSSYPYWQFWSRNGGKSIHVISARNLCMEETCLAASQYIFLVIWFPIFPYTCLFIDSTIEYRFSKWCHKKWEKKKLHALSSYFWLFCLMNHTNMHQYSLLFKYLFIKWQWQQSLCHYTLPLSCLSVFHYYVFLSSFIMSFCLWIVLSWKVSFQLSYTILSLLVVLCHSLMELF